MNVEIREARSEDAGQIATLIADLGHRMSAEAIRERILSLQGSDCVQLVAADGERILGLCGLHVMHAIHRPLPVGRITILEVAEEVRGRGIGRTLVAAAEERLRSAGCGLLEVTSNERLVEAHGFYSHLGFEQTSRRFAKALA